MQAVLVARAVSVRLARREQAALAAAAALAGIPMGLPRMPVVRAVLVPKTPSQRAERQGRAAAAAAVAAPTTVLQPAAQVARGLATAAAVVAGACAVRVVQQETAVMALLAR